MGRIKQTFIKRTGDKLVEKFPKNFKTDFETNKKSLQELINSGNLNCPSKPVRNKLAGYIVKLKQPKSAVTYKPPTKEKKKDTRKPFRRRL